MFPVDAGPAAGQERSDAEERVHAAPECRAAHPPQELCAWQAVNTGVCAMCIAQRTKLQYVLHKYCYFYVNFQFCSKFRNIVCFSVYCTAMHCAVIDANKINNKNTTKP